MDHELEMKELSMKKVIGLIFVPTVILTGVYVMIGLHWQKIPSIALFYVLATFILFPIELGIVMKASKKKYGEYSLKSAFVNHSKLRKREIALYGVILFLFAGAMSATISPIESILVSPIAGWVEQLTPEYFDCTDVELTGSYSKEILLFTSIVFLIMNAFVGPIIEEFFLEDI